MLPKNSNAPKISASPQAVGALNSRTRFQLLIGGDPVYRTFFPYAVTLHFAATSKGLRLF